MTRRGKGGRELSRKIVGIVGEEMEKDGVGEVGVGGEGWSRRRRRE